MKEFIELAQKIKNEELRKKVIDFLKDPKLSHKEYRKYPMETLKEGKTLFGSTNTTAERDILNHSLALAELCLKTADVIEQKYGIKLNRDNLIAASILHDIMHLYEYRKTKEGIEHTGLSLDHTTLAVAEFYAREFPEDLIHIIAAHAGEAGLTTPRNFDALIFHHLDNMIAMAEFHLHAKKSEEPVQLVMLDEETIKKMMSGEEPGKKKNK